MISTLSELFHGNRELFKGLWIDEQTDYAWTAYPVIRLDLSATQVSNAADEINFSLLVAELRANGVELLGITHQRQFR